MTFWPMSMSLPNGYCLRLQWHAKEPQTKAINEILITIYDEEDSFSRLPANESINVLMFLKDNWAMSHSGQFVLIPLCL